jgi:hypothetical protein
MPLEDWVQHSAAAKFLYDWQTLVAGGLALMAALIAVWAARLKERRETEAMRRSLAVEIRRLVNILLQTHQAFAAAQGVHAVLAVSDIMKQTARGVPVVYPATADRIGLLKRKNLAQHVVTFYANLKDIEFAGRMTGGEPKQPTEPKHLLSPDRLYVSPDDLNALAALIEKACQSALPLLPKLPRDKGDAGLKAKIEAMGDSARRLQPAPQESRRALPWWRRLVRRS